MDIQISKECGNGLGELYCTEADYICIAHRPDATLLEVYDECSASYSRIVINDEGCITFD